MVNFAGLDPRITILDQLDETEAPVTLVNVFNVSPEDVDDLLVCWTADAEFMKRQPGFIYTQLHRGIGQSTTFLNYAVWESVQDFRKAFEHPEFQRQLAHYPASVVSHPHLFRKVAVSNICVAS